MSGGFDTYGPSLHLYKALIEDLLTNGNTVHLVESHSSGQFNDAPDSLISDSGFTYETIKINVVKKRAFVRRYLTGIWYCLKSINVLKSKKKKGYDVVLVQSCPWAPFAVSFAKKILKIPVIWNIQDMFPGASIANGAMKRKWMQYCFYKFHHIAYKNADHITVISEDMREKVIEQKVLKSKITVIPDWYDDRSVKEIPWEKNLFVKKYDMKKDRFYVQYAGTMGFNFDYRMVVEVAKLLKDEKDIVFQMIGFGSQKDDFISLAEKEGLSNIVFYPLEPQNMVSHVYSACSVCLIPLPKGVIGNSVPSKAGLLMACRRVIVNSVDENSSYYNMFNEHKLGISASNESPEGIAKAILYLKNNPIEKDLYAQNAKAYSEKTFSRHINTKKYIQLFGDIASNNKARQNTKQ